MKKFEYFTDPKGKVWQREREPYKRTNVGTCPFCKISVYVSPGQALKYFRGLPTHKKCRKVV